MLVLYIGYCFSFNVHNGEVISQVVFKALLFYTLWVIFCLLLDIFLQFIIDKFF